MHELTTWLIAGAAAVGFFGVVLTLTWLMGRRSWFATWLRGPLSWLGFAVAVWILFRLAGRATGEAFALAFVAAAVVGGVVHFTVGFGFSVFSSRRRAIHLPPLLRGVIVGGVYVVAFFAAVKILVPDFSLSPLLVASGVLSLVVGLAFQDVLANFISGVTLAVEQPLRRDDWVEIEGHEGKVVDVTWRTTKILTRHNDYLVFPNRKIAETPLRNYSQPSRLHRETVYLGLPYRTLPSMAERALLDALSRVPGILRRPQPTVEPSEFDDYSIKYRIAYYIDQYGDEWKLSGALNREIFFSLQRHGIVVPYPTRTNFHTNAEPLPTGWMEPHLHQLVVIAGRRSGDVLPLLDETAVIGRGDDCPIDLHDPTTSKEHARIESTAEGFRLTDAGSKHGTHVNGKPIESVLLHSGDEIAVGETVLRYERILPG